MLCYYYSDIIQGIKLLKNRLTFHLEPVTRHVKDFNIKDFASII